MGKKEKDIGKNASDRWSLEELAEFRADFCPN